MHITSIALHTTGNDPTVHQVLETGLVMDRTDKLLPIEQLPHLRLLVIPNRLDNKEIPQGPEGAFLSAMLRLPQRSVEVRGQPTQLAKLSDLLLRIDNPDVRASDLQAGYYDAVVEAHSAIPVFLTWFKKNAENNHMLLCCHAPGTTMAFFEGALNGSKVWRDACCIDPSVYHFDPVNADNNDDINIIYNKIGINYEELVSRSLVVAGPGTLLLAEDQLRLLRAAKSNLYANCG